MPYCQTQTYCQKNFRNVDCVLANYRQASKLQNHKLITVPVCGLVFLATQ